MTHEITTDTFTVYGCRCDQPVLDRLIAAAGVAVPPHPVTLEATWQGTRLRSDSLSAIRTAIGRSLNPGDPRRLETLRIDAVRDDRAVTVELTDKVTVTVTSPDAAWALGKAEQLRRILVHATVRPRRLRPWPLPKPATVIWIEGPFPPRGWRTWATSDRIAALAVMVAALAALSRLVTA